jgi:hypothetical protein
VASGVGNSGGVRSLDGDTRRSISRAPAVLPAGVCSGAVLGPPEILLFIYREYCFSHYVAAGALSVARFKLLYITVPGLAGIPGCIFRPGLDR